MTPNVSEYSGTWAESCSVASVRLIRGTKTESNLRGCRVWRPGIRQNGFAAGDVKMMNTVLADLIYENPANHEY